MYIAQWLCWDTLEGNNNYPYWYAIFLRFAWNQDADSSTTCSRIELMLYYRLVSLYTTVSENLWKLSALRCTYFFEYICGFFFFDIPSSLKFWNTGIKREEIQALWYSQKVQWGKIQTPLEKKYSEFYLYLFYVIMHCTFLSYLTDVSFLKKYFIHS